MSAINDATVASGGDKISITDSGNNVDQQQPAARASGSRMFLDSRCSGCHGGSCCQSYFESDGEFPAELILVVLMTMCIGLGNLDFNPDHRFEDNYRNRHFKPQQQREDYLREAVRRYHLLGWHNIIPPRPCPSGDWKAKTLEKWLKNNPVPGRQCQDFLRKTLWTTVYGLSSSEFYSSTPAHNQSSVLGAMIIGTIESNRYNTLVSTRPLVPTKEAMLKEALRRARRYQKEENMPQFFHYRDDELYKWLEKNPVQEKTCELFIKDLCLTLLLSYGGDSGMFSNVPAMEDTEETEEIEMTCGVVIVGENGSDGNFSPLTDDDASSAGLSLASVIFRALANFLGSFSNQSNKSSVIGLLLNGDNDEQQMSLSSALADA